MSTYLEAIDGEKTAENALLETRAQHDHIVLLIHVRSISMSLKTGFRVYEMRRWECDLIAMREDQNNPTSKEPNLRP